MLQSDGPAGAKRARCNPDEDRDEHARVAGLQNSLLELHHRVFDELEQSAGATERRDVEQRYAEKLPEFAEGAKESHAIVLKTDDGTCAKFGVAMAYLHDFRSFLVNGANSFFDSLQRAETRESARALRVARALQEDVERCFEEAIESMAIELLADMDSEAEDADSEAGESVSDASEEGSAEEDEEDDDEGGSQAEPSSEDEDELESGGDEDSCDSDNDKDAESD